MKKIAYLLLIIPAYLSAAADTKAAAQKRRLEEVLAAPDLRAAMKPLSDADIKELKELVEAQINDAKARRLAPTALEALELKQKAVELENRRIRADVRGLSDEERKAKLDDRKERAGLTGESQEDRAKKIAERKERAATDTRRPRN